MRKKRVNPGPEQLTLFPLPVIQKPATDSESETAPSQDLHSAPKRTKRPRK